jgi:acetyltransferase-like isoleucine patch superfamily enzyme
MNNQFRKHLVFTRKHRLRLRKAQKTLGLCGKAVHVDKNVEFMRFPQNISIHDNVAIKEGVRICSCNTQATISIGENTTIGYHNFIFASEKILIGANCLIAPFVYIVDSDQQINKSTRKLNGSYYYWQRCMDSLKRDNSKRGNNRRRSHNCSRIGS